MIQNLPPNWEPKYVNAWTATQEEVIVATLEVVQRNMELEKSIHQMGLGSVPWMAMKVHADSLQLMFVENPTGLEHPVTGGHVEGDERETRLLVCRYFYQKALELELIEAKRNAARSMLLGATKG